MEFVTGPIDHPHLSLRIGAGGDAPLQPEGYALRINRRGVRVDYRDARVCRA